MDPRLALEGGPACHDVLGGAAWAEEDGEATANMGGESVGAGADLVGAQLDAGKQS